MPNAARPNAARPNAARPNAARAFAPATVANLAVGFDLLGLALSILGDEVSVKKTEESSITLKGDLGPLPRDPEKNTATIPLLHMLEDKHASFGLEVTIKKGIPLSSGLGGSAASAVASVVALNALLDTPFTKDELFAYALEGERVASGGVHGDNVAPCLYGGLTLCVEDRERPHALGVKELPVPDLNLLLIHPHREIPTEKARGALSSTLTLKDHLAQQRYLASFLSALYSRDWPLLLQNIQDVVVEPQRASLLPEFPELKEAALKAGARAFSFSGAGPTLFAVLEEGTEERVKEKLTQKLDQSSIQHELYLDKISKTGAYLMDE